jgi:hypothetical protein
MEVVMRKHRDIENLASVTRKRRKSFPSEAHVKRGRRFVHGDVELTEKTRSQRSMFVWFGAQISRTAA